METINNEEIEIMLVLLNDFYEGIGRSLEAGKAFDKVLDNPEEPNEKIGAEKMKLLRDIKLNFGENYNVAIDGFKEMKRLKEQKMEVDLKNTINLITKLNELKFINNNK